MSCDVWVRVPSSAQIIEDVKLTALHPYFLYKTLPVLQITKIIEKEQTPIFTSFRDKLQCYLTEDKSETSFSSVSALSFIIIIKCILCNNQQIGKTHKRTSLIFSYKTVLSHSPFSKDF